MAGLRLLTLLFSGAVILSVLWIQAVESQEMEKMELPEGKESILGSSGDGFNMGCTDCGDKCKPLCGSRRFRLCCLTYMKKRASSSVRFDFINPADVMTIKRSNPYGSSEHKQHRVHYLGLGPWNHLISLDDVVSPQIYTSDLPEN